MSEVPLDEVGALLRHAAATAVVPRFCHLDTADVSEKAPGEVVTVADREAEEVISAGLRRLLPDSVVVGEEASAADPGLLSELAGGRDVWLVDPVDGTANFAAGRRPFALMVALLRAGRLTASWILDPLAEDLAVARAGAGVRLNGEPVRLTAEERPPEALRGVAATRFLPPPLRGTVESGGRRLGHVHDGQHCAGREYVDLLAGRQEFMLFWRTLPWDHAPGVLLAREAGGVARRLDGAEYHPADERSGLLVAANERIWRTVRDLIVGD